VLQCKKKCNSRPKTGLERPDAVFAAVCVAIVLGLVGVLFMGIIGNVIPLATGVITDTLAGNAVPFEHSTEARVGIPVTCWPDRDLAARFPFTRLEAAERSRLLLDCDFVREHQGFLSFMARWKLIGVSRDIEFDIRNDLLKRLLLLEPEFYVRNRTGELMSRATNDLNSVRMVLGPGIMYSATTLVTMIFAIVVMVALSPSLTLWVLLPAPVVAVAVWFFGRTIHDLYEKIQAALATLTARVQENLSGVRVVRAYAQEEAEQRQFDEPNREYVCAQHQADSHLEHVHAIAAGVDRHHFLIVLWQGGHQLLRGQISLGALIAFNAYLTLLVWPMIALGWSLIFFSVARRRWEDSVTYFRRSRVLTIRLRKFHQIRSRR